MMDKHTVALISIIGSSLDVLGALYLAVPARRMGIFGVGLILIGFTLQSVQYWLALLDVLWGRLAVCAPIGNRRARRLPTAAQDVILPHSAG
jgi:hypothetical protein